MAAAFPNGIRCQKCLQMGHWTYECREKRKYVQRDSRTKLLDKNLAARANDLQNKQEISKVAVAVKRKAVETNMKGQHLSVQDHITQRQGKKFKKYSRNSSSSSSSDTDSDSSSRSDSESDDSQDDNSNSSTSNFSSSSDSSSPSSSSSNSLTSSESDDFSDSSCSDNSEQKFLKN